MAAMEELFRPVPAIRAIRHNSSICRKRSLADVCPTLYCDGIAKKMQKSFSAMAACKKGDSERCSHVPLPDSLHSVNNLDSFKDSSANVSLDECGVRAGNDSLDLNADFKENEKAGPELRVLRWKTASRLAFMYEAGLLEWQTDAPSQLRVTSEASGYGEEQLDLSNINKSGTNDLDLRQKMTAKKVDEEDGNHILLRAKQKEGFGNSKEQSWASMMVAMFSSISEEAVQIFPGICNPTELMCKL